MSYREKYFSDYHAEPQLRPNGKASKSIMHIMVIGINGIFRQRHNGKVIKVDTFKTKASQFDHTDDIEMHDKTKEHLQNSHDWLPASVGF